jgi:uncharacterized integral membrane protein
MRERGRTLRLGRRAYVRIGATVVLLLLFALFVLENARTVRIRFLLFDTDTRLAWALLLAGVLGFLIGMVTTRLQRWF